MKMLNKCMILSFCVLGGNLLSASPETMEIQAPQAIEIIKPDVPVNYKRWGIKGHVVVTFQINEEGRPVEIRLVDYDDRVYAKNVENALRQWRFEKPGVQGITYRLPIHFI